ncbi:MAG: FG-GAP repeat domain-containing protein, partial [Planctomycetota bacterium]
MRLDSNHRVGVVLLALTVLPAGCGRPSDGGVEGEGAVTGPPWFTEITEQSGVHFRHDAGVDGSYYFPQIMGAGGAFLDYDGDGDLDVYLPNGRHREGTPGPAPMNRLLRREEDGTYRDVTDSSGLGDEGFGMGVAVGDYDNDGRPDVYAINYGPDRLYRNNGDGTFTDVTASAGVHNAGWGTSGSFVDFDRDGYLDLVVVNYVHYPEYKACQDAAGRIAFCGPLAAPPEPDVLFRNRGDGTFEDVTRSSGLGRRAARGLGVLCEDFDDDGWPDIYVANDAEPNFLWVNRRDGTFDEQAVRRGLALNAQGQPEGSMGVACGDLDGDGDVDLFVTHLMRETNTVYVNRGGGIFTDRTAPSGLAMP